MIGNLIEFWYGTPSILYINNVYLVSYFVFQYKFKEKEPKNKNDNDTIEYNSMFLNYCTAEEVPYYEIYDVFWDVLEERDTHSTSFWNVIINFSLEDLIISINYIFIFYLRFFKGSVCTP